MDSLVRRIQVAFQALKRNMEAEVMCKDGPAITRPQMFLMYTIRQHGTCKLTYLAETLDVKPSAVTVMIDRLEKEQYVRRLHDKTDRRVVLVEITETGEQALEKAIEIRNAVLQSLLARLDTHEIKQFADLLERIAGTKETN